ncbi:MAG: hypothetical protein ABI693_33740 [Bryobacteraceae bacterium]
MKSILAVAMMSVMMTTAGLGAVPAKMLSKSEVHRLLESANTPADHNKLAQHYRLQADQLDAEAAEHTAMAKAYRAKPGVSEMKRPMSPDTASHCDYFAESLMKAATEARALSAAHLAMVK